MTDAARIASSSSEAIVEENILIAAVDSVALEEWLFVGSSGRFGYGGVSGENATVTYYLLGA